MKLDDFFKKYNKVAIAFSGGVDSAFLLYYAAVSHCDIAAYYVKSQFQPEFEYNDACKLANQLNIKLNILNIDILANNEITKNPYNRCYYCKKMIFATIINKAKIDGYEVVIEGTNASDDINDRPGYKALQELGVLSPLKICDLTKNDIRIMSKNAELFTFSKPSYACLATRVKTDETITKDLLINIEKAENYLFEQGFSDFRVRVNNNNSLIQLPLKQFSRYYEMEEKITNYLGALFNNVCLDIDNPR